MSTAETPAENPAQVPGFLRPPLLSEYISEREAERQGRTSYAVAAPLMLVGAFLTGYQSIRIGDINLTFADLAFAAAFGLCVWRGQLTSRPFGGMTTLWLAGLALIFGGLMISTLFNGDMVRWFVITIQYLFGYLFLPMMLLALPTWLSKRVVLAFILGMFMMEAVGIFVSLTMTHDEAAELFSIELLAGNGRLAGFASEPNWNSQLIAMALPLAIYMHARKQISFWMLAILAATLVWALLLSASFTGFVATTISVTITLLFLGLKRVAGAVVLVSMAGALFVASGAPIPQIFEQRVGDALMEGTLDKAGTFNGRLKLVRQAWESVDETFLIGYGAEGFRRTNDIMQPVHNLYLLMLMDGGIIALLGFILLTATLVWIPFSVRSRDLPAKGMVLAIVAVFLIYTQASPHMFSRLNINPVMFAMMLLFVSARGGSDVTRQLSQRGRGRA